MEPMVSSKPEQSGETASAGGSAGPTSTTPLPLLLLFEQPDPHTTSTNRLSPSPSPSLLPRDDPSETNNLGSSTDRTESTQYALVLGSQLLGSAQRHAEKAFWGVLVPSLSGLVGWGEALQGALQA
jgi:hypothetical protein